MQRYLALVYPRECKRWAEANPGHTAEQTCSPAANPAIDPERADFRQASAPHYHLFGGDSAPSYRAMASEKDWNAHKVEHALRHTQGMVPIKLTPQMLDAPRGIHQFVQAIGCIGVQHRFEAPAFAGAPQDEDRLKVLILRAMIGASRRTQTPPINLSAGNAAR